MAEEEVQTNEDEDKKGTPILLLALVGALSLAAGGAGVFFLMPAPQPAEGTVVVEVPVDDDAAPFSERTLSLDPFVVNVGDEGYPRYLKLGLVLELDTPESKEELEERVPQVRDMTILLLSAKRLEELSDFEGKALLKEDLRDRVGALLADGAVESVLFTEFVVQ